jgi:hypothetical protein
MLINATAQLIAVLLGIVIYFFVRWCNTGQRTVAVSAAIDLIYEKNLEGEAGKVPPETTIGKASEVVMPLADHYVIKKGKVRRFQ